MSRPFLRSAVVAVALLLTGPASPASAQEFAVGSPEFQRARDIAQAHWGAVPCQGQVQFSWQGLEPLTNARATWSNPTDAWANVGANFDCSVVFNTLTQYDFPMLCTVMAHELGHLLGRQHEAQDGQLMSAIYSVPLPECGGTPATAAADQQAGEADPGARRVAKPAARKKKSTRRASKKTSVKRKRCVVRMKSGKRVRRCVPLKKSASPKARTASHKPRSRTYVAH